MPLLTLDGASPCHAEDGQRLVLALENCGINIGHRCGGKARCTTCRVRITEGEPDLMTRAEYEKLKERDLLGEVRLACQVLVEAPMTVEVLMTVEEMGWDDPGPEPAPQVEPEPDWLPKGDL